MKDTEDTEDTQDMGGAGAGAGAGAELRGRFAAEVDWAKVVDPYVPGPDGQYSRYGPDLLERLWSPDLPTADDALAALHFACCGDGGSVRSAAPEVLPFLVEAVRDPAVRVRPQILETLAVLARAAESCPKLGGRRHAAPAAWPAAWERAVDALLPGLGDDVEGDEDVRAGVAAVLARAVYRADDLVDRFLARFDEEPDLSVAEQLVRAVGELAPHAVERREHAVAWLRRRTTDAGKGEEPNMDGDIDVWIAWTEQHGHDVRQPAIVALRRALRPL
ncbi:hypothetical protein [Streptomyces sp. NPDC088719]|uniref:hypothetical protein n=1 Tax=Streptomyces sp. NPDC088719 TaxID=3365872 RepID=UPI0038182498